MKDSLEIIKEMNVPVNQIRLSGGGAKSLLWRQIQSDIYNRAVVTVNITEGAAYGAALLATVRTGIYGSVEQACKNTIKVISSLNPDIKNVPVYEKYYRIYQSLYKSLKDEYRKL
jgi:xylulokinase